MNSIGAQIERGHEGPEWYQNRQPNEYAIASSMCRMFFTSFDFYLSRYSMIAVGVFGRAK